jgi:iron complex transport system ATP-binding protein
MIGLVASNVSLSLGRRMVLDRIDLAFARGRVTVLLGPNGAGKSSLLACLAGLRMPDAGYVALDGDPVSRLDPRARGRRIGLLPQTGEVHWNVDVATLVGLGRLPHRGRFGETEADRAAIARAMAATDVTHLADRAVERLSGGERGRVLLARVLAGEPEWLLADEPLASLDPAHQIDVLGRLHDAARAGAGVIAVLHDLNQAGRVADDVVLLREGRMVAAGPAETVLTAPLIAKTYGITVDIGRTADGRRFIVPLDRG